MSFRSGFIFLAAATFVACARPTAAVSAGMPEHLQESSLAIETVDGRRHVFRVRIARSPQDRSRGLMRVTSLPEDGGMLFDLDGQAMVSMWMKNTPLSLDMIFILDDGRISSIARETTPFSRRSISSLEPVRAVLEIGGGISDRLEIREGDRVVHPLFTDSSREESDGSESGG